MTSTVYDLTVARDHNYFAAGVLVHNKGPLLEACGGWNEPVVCDESDHALEFTGSSCDPPYGNAGTFLGGAHRRDSQGMGGEGAFGGRAGIGGIGGHASPSGDQLVISVAYNTENCLRYEAPSTLIVLGAPHSAFEVYFGRSSCERGEVIVEGVTDERGFAEFGYDFAQGPLTVAVERKGAECYGITDQWGLPNSDADFLSGWCAAYLDAVEGDCVSFR